MKRRFLAAALTLAMVFSLTVFAVDEAVVDNGDGSYTVTATVAPGAAAGLVVTPAGVALGDGDVLYLGQETADEGGTVRFSNVRLSSWRSADFYVNGQKVGSTEVPGTVVSGTVTLAGRQDYSGVSVSLSDQRRVVYVARTKYDGSYVTDALPEGLYTVTASMDRYVTQEEINVDLSGTDVVCGAALSLRGDLTDDGKVDQADMDALMVDFGQSVVAKEADFNGDGYVNEGDMAPLLELIGGETSAADAKDVALDIKMEPGRLPGYPGLFEVNFYCRDMKLGCKLVAGTLSFDNTVLTLATDKGVPIQVGDGNNQATLPALKAAVESLTTEGEVGLAAYVDGGRTAVHAAAVTNDRVKGLPFLCVYLKLVDGKTEADLKQETLRLESDKGAEGFLARCLAEDERYGARVDGRFYGAAGETGLAATLTYPGMDRQVLQSLALTGAQELLIPEVPGGTAGLTMTLVAKDLLGADMPVETVWTLGRTATGVSLTPTAAGAMTARLAVTDKTTKGTAVVTATAGGKTAEAAVYLGYDLRPTSLKVTQAGRLVGDTDTLPQGAEVYPYGVEVLDQFGQPLTTVGDAVWTLVGDEYISCAQDGVVTVKAGVRGGAAYGLTVGLGGLTRTVTLNIQADSPSGGGGGGGSPTPKPTPTPVPPTAGEAASVTVEAVKGTDGVYTAKLPAAAVKDMVKAAKAAGGSVDITAKVGTDAKKVAMVLPKEAVSGVADNEKAALTVKTPEANVTLPKAALDALAKEGKAVTVTAEANSDGTVSVSVAAGETVLANVAGGIKVLLPTKKDGGSGFTMGIDHGDAGYEKIRKSVWSENGMAAVLNGSTDRLCMLSGGVAFSDTEFHWAYEAIAFVSGHELFSGTGDNFAPDGAMTRGMVATVLCRLEQGKAKTAAEFHDVRADAWYAPGVAWAVENGVATGSGAGFAPDADVTREQLAVMLYNYAQAFGMDIAKGGDLAGFADGERVAPWAADAMGWTLDAGIITGRDAKTLAPQGTATRAEVAVMLQRLVRAMF